jgi:hypothetical protein
VELRSEGAATRASSRPPDTCSSTSNAALFAPDRIAETYWALHTQPAADWNAETVFDGQ